MTEDQRRALAPLLIKLGPMLEVFSELERGMPVTTPRPCTLA